MLPRGATEGISEGAPVRPSPVPVRMQQALVAALLLCFLALGWVGRDPIQLASGDDLTYLSLSRSLESGSYREIFRASAPLHVMYPPAYPAWLVLVRHATDNRLDLILVSNLFLVALSLLILFAVARQLAGPWFALSLLLLLVLSHGLLWMGGSLYSEALFLFLSTAALAATRMTDRYGQRAAYAAIALALLAFLTRSAGISVVLAVGVWLWSRRKTLELTTYAIASVTVVGGWFAYVALASSNQTVRSYAIDLSYRPHKGIVSEVARVWQNAVIYGTEILPVELSFPTIPNTLIDNWIWLGLEIVLLAASLVILWKTWRAAAAYLPMYAGLLIVWPFSDNRLLDPVIPLTMLAFLLGAWRLTGRLNSRVRTPTLCILTALLAFGAVHGDITRMEHYRHCDRTNPYTSAGCYDAETRSIVAASEYIRDRLPSADVVLLWRPSVVHFLTGRAAESASLMAQVPQGGATRALRDWRVQHVLLTAFTGFEREQLAHRLLESCHDLWVEARFAPHAILFATSAPPGATSDACSDLAAFVRDNKQAPNLALQ
jgi:hypothetical protein